jgi:Catalytic LigB subunit of aromatic ring-opening dioxygenase
MAKIVLGVGSSHSPLLNLAGEQWVYRSQDDRRNPQLNTLDGRLISYDQLVAERGEPYVAQCDPRGFPALAERAEQALDILADAIHAARPDVVLVVGDDQGEFFTSETQPAITVFHGPELAMRPWETMKVPPWADRLFWSRYRMDQAHRWSGAPALGMDLVKGLIRQGVDVASADRVSDPTQRGFGHAFGFVIERLLKERPVPVLPILLNTYFPPNVPTAARCLEIGAKVHAALAASACADRVVVIASGGLSHFLCEEAFDRRLVDALRTKNVEQLSQLSQESMISGSSEVRNWITVAGMVPHLDCGYAEYMPVYRTPAGTGIGLGFMTWS